MTFHKVQSLTLKDGAIVDLVRPPRIQSDPAAVYVMLSRVQRLDRLWVLRDFSLEVLNSLANMTKDQADELKDLETKDKDHLKHFAARHHTATHYRDKPLGDGRGRGTSHNESKLDKFCMDLICERASYMYIQQETATNCVQLVSACIYTCKHVTGGVTGQV
jgi:hypothetical protein